MALPNPTTVRFPEEVREEITALALRERRSFSKQVLVLVEAGLAKLKASGEPDES
jgi:hypothetical protein